MYLICCNDDVYKIVKKKLFIYIDFYLLWKVLRRICKRNTKNKQRSYFAAKSVYQIYLTKKYFEYICYQYQASYS